MNGCLLSGVSNKSLTYLGDSCLQRISDAFQRSQSLGTNGYVGHPPSIHLGSQASQFSKASGMRSSDLPPLSRTPRAGEPALDRGANMLMPQVGLSWVHAA